MMTTAILPRWRRVTFFGETPQGGSKWTGSENKHFLKLGKTWEQDKVVDGDDDDDYEDNTCEKRRIRSPTAKLSSRMPRKTFTTEMVRIMMKRMKTMIIKMTSVMIKHSWMQIQRLYLEFVAVFFFSRDILVQHPLQIFKYTNIQNMTMERRRETWICMRLYGNYIFIFSLHSRVNYD